MNEIRSNKKDACRVCVEKRRRDNECNGVSRTGDEEKKGFLQNGELKTEKKMTIATTLFIHFLSHSQQQPSCLTSLCLCRPSLWGFPYLDNGSYTHPCHVQLSSYLPKEKAV